MIKLKILLKSKVFLLCLLFLSFFSIYFYNSRAKKSIYSKSDTSFVCVVSNISKNNKVVLDCDEILEGSFKNIDNIEIGDIVKVEGTLKEYDEQRNFNLFDYKEYQNNSNKFYKIDVNNYYKIGKTKNIILNIKNILYKRIENLKSYSYLKALILGDKSEIDSDTISSFKGNGIIHLFSISGMHISLLIDIIEFLHKRNSRGRDLFIITFLVGYYELIKSISLFRCVIFYISKRVNNNLNLKIDSKKLYFIDVCLIIILKTSYIYNIGFYYSVIISIGISLLGKKILKYKNKIIRVVFISSIAFLLSFPLNMYTNYEINLLSVLYNIIFVLVISMFIFPLSLITLLFPLLDNILSFFIEILEKTSLFLSDINLTFIFKKPSILIIIIYYLVILLFFYNKRFIYLIIIFLFVHYNYNVFFKDNYVIVLDVGQGDSIFIHYDNYSTLIDTGGVYTNYSLSKNITIPLLKSLGISQIDSLVLSHGDYDHIGESLNIVNNVKVKQVIFNCGEINELEENLIEILEKKKIPYYSCIKELNMKNNKLIFLNTKGYDNENDNSSVIYAKLDGYKFLFMGDASLYREKDIIEKYQLSEIDVLKVGHHGSKTSSSKEFIDYINPKYSVISVGANNRYGHPNKEVLENIKSSKVYRTDLDGSIMFKIREGNLDIKKCIS